MSVTVRTVEGFFCAKFQIHSFICVPELNLELAQSNSTMSPHLNSIGNCCCAVHIPTDALRAQHNSLLTASQNRNQWVICEKMSVGICRLYPNFLKQKHFLKRQRCCPYQLLVNSINTCFGTAVCGCQCSKCVNYLCLAWHHCLICCKFVSFVIVVSSDSW